MNKLSTRSSQTTAKQQAVKLNQPLLNCCGMHAEVWQNLCFLCSLTSMSAGNVVTYLRLLAAGLSAGICISQGCHDRGFVSHSYVRSSTTQQMPAMHKKPSSHVIILFLRFKFILKFKFAGHLFVHDGDIRIVIVVQLRFSINQSTNSA